MAANPQKSAHRPGDAAMEHWTQEDFSDGRRNVTTWSVRRCSMTVTNTAISDSTATMMTPAETTEAQRRERDFF
jgi:hypothetical protein